MNRIYKAYKATFPKLFDYTKDMWDDEKQYKIIYGISQKDAVNKFCSSDEVYTYWELKKHIRTRRFPEKDLYTQEKSILLNDLTDKQVSHLTHSLGVSIGDIIPKKFYRNYSAYGSEYKECEILVQLGLMSKRKYKEQFVYHVTDKGIEVVKTLLLITKE